MLELYVVHNPETKKSVFKWAHTMEHALEDFPIGTFAAKCETDQGYPIVRLRDVPKGSYFHRVTLRDGEFCEHSVVWCKGEYDHSTKKWFCHKYEDVNHSRLYKGEERVSIDFTF